MTLKSAAVRDEFPKTGEILEYFNLECVFLLVCLTYKGKQG